MSDVDPDLEAADPSEPDTAPTGAATGAARQVPAVALAAGVVGGAGAALGFAALGGVPGIVLVAGVEAAAITVLLRWSAWR